MSDCMFNVVLACVFSPLLLWLAYVAVKEAMEAFMIGTIKRALEEEDGYLSAKYRPLHVLLESGYEKIIASRIHDHKYTESHCSTEEVVALVKEVCHDEMKKGRGK